MLEKLVFSIVLALISWLEKRIEKGKIAIDADLDFDRLRAAGSRIDAWVQQNSASNGGKPSSNGPQQ
jgi:hypothetical protein